jgi:U4/U6 small nuclear ribonucleoprotein PRP4
MSDDEDDVILVKKQKTIHYGSLADDHQTVGKLTDLGSINTSSDYFDLEQEVSKDKALLLEEFERKKKARQIHVR